MLLQQCWVGSEHEFAELIEVNLRCLKLAWEKLRMCRGVTVTMVTAWPDLSYRVANARLLLLPL